jgi:Fibronectin type III domain
VSSQTETPATATDVSGTFLSVACNNSAWGSSPTWPSSGEDAGGTTGITHCLQLTNCGFSVAGGSTISGFNFSNNRFRTGSGSAKDALIALIIGGTVSGSNYAITGTGWPTSAAAQSYGTGTTDLWGNSAPTVSQTNASNLGIAVAVTLSATSTVANINTSTTVTVYYTGGGSAPGIPGQPTVTAKTGSTVSITYAQGSGTVNDNPGEYSSNGGSSWTTFDPSTAQTSATITGLSAATLYLLQVAAKNTNGTSSYSPWIAGWTGPVQSVTKTLAVSGGSLSNWSLQGGGSSVASVLNGGGGYIQASANATNALTITFPDLPTNAIWVTAVQLNLTMKTSNGSDVSPPTAQVNQQGGSGTDIPNMSTFGNLTTSYANYSISVSNLDQQTYNGGLLMTASLFNDISALLVEPDANGTIQIEAASLQVTFWVPLIPIIACNDHLCGGMETMCGGL